MAGEEAVPGYTQCFDVLLVACQLCFVFEERSRRFNPEKKSLNYKLISMSKYSGCFAAV